VVLSPAGRRSCLTVCLNSTPVMLKLFQDRPLQRHRPQSP
jgi:hypothetical protein